MLTTPLAVLNNLSAFRGERQVLNGFNLTLHEGESVAILGPNGCGKSTLLKLLTRDLYHVDQPDSQLLIKGQSQINLMQLRTWIGMVSQDLQALYTPYTKGRDVVASGLFGAIGVHSHLNLTDAQQLRVDQVMADLHLEGLSETMFQRLSTGQQRRLLLARALIHQPSTLIFDEPTNSLDLQAAFELIATMRQLVQSGTNLIIATHHVQEIIPEVQRIILMKQGRIVADGDKKQVLTTDNLSALYGIALKLMEQDGFYQVYPA
ncbi:iron complex transport system ATP-binding protein [Oceanospirillum multiglobuliferum]|uniref:Molybdenum ABC transporter ATP-binding protein n=1 Tax=Oceanospirillum multiglobuliferum TaxID=64969 RepID=A0A1T4S9M0_9GAMM|nr:ATP-binding cassette domain-containing protein [Oceanospirillum multiglobuliferum]OPX54348.1 molybdenum ABC transporter ATP-binding protein [Oceanospirillum multiglobuliferum]SKA24944.1 iron complex transport system ATP-binding protein [Oceanospirillum multiglobuliferum]